jgi:hypothetical protein
MTDILHFCACDAEERKRIEEPNVKHGILTRCCRKRLKRIIFKR